MNEIQDRDVQIIQETAQPKRSHAGATPASAARPRTLRRVESDTEDGEDDDKENTSDNVQLLEKVTPSRLSCLQELRDEFSCSICLDICVRPCTTPCGHSFCRGCLRTALMHSTNCPKCRTRLPPGCALKINTSMWNAILLLFPQQEDEPPTPSQDPCTQTQPAVGNGANRLPAAPRSDLETLNQLMREISGATPGGSPSPGGPTGALLMQLMDQRGRMPYRPPRMQQGTQGIGGPLSQGLMSGGAGGPLGLNNPFLRQLPRRTGPAAGPNRPVGSPVDLAQPRSVTPPRDITPTRHMTPTRNPTPPRDLTPPRFSTPPRHMTPPRQDAPPSNLSLFTDAAMASPLRQNLSPPPQRPTPNSGLFPTPSSVARTVSDWASTTPSSSPFPSPLPRSLPSWNAASLAMQHVAQHEARTEDQLPPDNPQLPSSSRRALMASLSPDTVSRALSDVLHVNDQDRGNNTQQTRHTTNQRTAGAPVEGNVQGAAAAGDSRTATPERRNWNISPGRSAPTSSNTPSRTQTTGLFQGAANTSPLRLTRQSPERMPRPAQHQAPNNPAAASSRLHLEDVDTDDTRQLRDQFQRELARPVPSSLFGRAVRGADQPNSVRGAAAAAANTAPLPGQLAPPQTQAANAARLPGMERSRSNPSTDAIVLLPVPRASSAQTGAGRRNHTSVHQQAQHQPSQMLSAGTSSNPIIISDDERSPAPTSTAPTQSLRQGRDVDVRRLGMMANQPADRGDIVHGLPQRQGRVDMDVQGPSGARSAWNNQHRQEEDLRNDVNTQRHTSRPSWQDQNNWQDSDQRRRAGSRAAELWEETNQGGYGEQGREGWNDRHGGRRPASGQDGPGTPLSVEADSVDYPRHGIDRSRQGYDGYGNNGGYDDDRSDQPRRPYSADYYDDDGRTYDDDSEYTPTERDDYRDDEYCNSPGVYDYSQDDCTDVGDGESVQLSPQGHGHRDGTMHRGSPRMYERTGGRADGWEGSPRGYQTRQESHHQAPEHGYGSRAQSQATGQQDAVPPGGARSPDNVSVHIIRDHERGPRVVSGLLRNHAPSARQRQPGGRHG